MNGTYHGTDSVHPVWYRPLLIFAGLFGAIGWPLSILIAIDGSLMLAFGVYVAGLVLVSLVCVAWMTESILNQPVSVRSENE